MAFGRVGCQVKTMPKSLKVDVLSNASSVKANVGYATHTTVLVAAQGPSTGDVTLKFSAMEIFLNGGCWQRGLVTLPHLLQVDIANGENVINWWALSFLGCPLVSEFSSYFPDFMGRCLGDCYCSNSTLYTYIKMWQMTKSPRGSPLLQTHNSACLLHKVWIPNHIPNWTASDACLLEQNSWVLPLDGSWYLNLSQPGSEHTPHFEGGNIALPVGRGSSYIMLQIKLRYVGCVIPSFCWLSRQYSEQ